MSDHVMTEEVKSLLLSRVPFGSSATIEYIPPLYKTKVKDADGNDTDQCELPVDYQAVFTIKAMSKQDSDKLSRIQNKKNQTDKDVEEYEKELKEVCRKYVVGWKNFFFAGDMSPIEYKTDPSGTGIDKALFDQFPVQLITELVIYITGISGLRTLDRSGL